jgi:sugar O-acyltransferase (sialic acid O-acetyltransferase NeuD family)
MSDAPTSRLIIVGGGGHARSVADVATRLGYELLAVIDPSNPVGWEVPVIADLDKLDARMRRAAFTVAIGSNVVRGREFERLAELGLDLTSVTAKTATVGGELADGSQVLEHAHVGPGAHVGRGVIVNTAAVVEHDAVIGDYVHVAPGARLLGGARIGNNALIGGGAVVLPFVSVGRGAVVGAGSVVIQDVPPDAVVSGVPARPH